MSALPDHEIHRRVCLPETDPLHMRITPFEPKSCKPPRTVSYGMSSYGYDIRLDRKFTLFPNLFYLMKSSPGTIADPPGDLIVDPVTLGEEIEQRIAKGQFQKFEGDELILPPGGFALAQSLEWIRVPRDCVGHVYGKSTYARCALNLNTTALEPAWKGHITLELANMCGLPLRVRANQGVGQVVFFQGTSQPNLCYASKGNGSYQGQTEPTPPKLL